MPLAPWISWLGALEDTGLAAAGGEEGLAEGAGAERRTAAGAVGDVEGGVARLDDGDGERLVALGDDQVGGGGEVLGELLEHLAGVLAQGGLEVLAELEGAETGREHAVWPATNQAMVDQGADQAVDDRAAQAELGSDLRRGEALGRGGHQLEYVEAATQGLRGVARARS